MKTKVLLGSVLLSAVGAGFLLAEWGTTATTYSPRSEEVRVRPDVEERRNGGDAIFRELRAMPDGSIDLAEISRTKEAVQRHMAKRSSLGLEWDYMGPTNRGGRTRAVLVDKDNSNRVYTGGVSGGIFISDNGGGTWRVYNDLMENLMISTIAQGNDGAIYVGTGCTFEGSAPMPGAGIFKSTDGGQTFNQLSSTDPTSEGLQWRYVNRIITNPNNGSEVYAGTSNGLYYSTDGGSTWNQSMYIDPNCNVFAPSEVEDLEYTQSGRLLVGYGGGILYSDTPTDPCSFVRPTGIPTQTQRIDIDFCEADNNIAYAIQVAGGFLAGVYQSGDGGTTWSAISPAPPTTTIDSTFSLFGDNGQGNYDLALEVKPDECDKIYIGGVQTYRVAGSWTRIAENFAPEFSGLYVHSDKHYFHFDPSNPNTMYVGSDGGIGKTTDAGAFQPTWTTQNRNYGTTQFYGISISRDGMVIGGTQDNGTWLIDPSRPGGAAQEGTSISGGDGFDCEVSNIGPLAFTTIQFGVVLRQNAVTQNATGITGGPGESGEGVAPFWSIVRLWESTNDPTSLDSVTFNNDTTELSLAKGNGATRTFSGTMLPVQPAGEINVGSVYFSNAFASLVQVVDDFDGDGILTTLNDSGNVVNAGTFDYSTGEYSVIFNVPPSDQSDIKGFFTSAYNAGDTLVLISATQNFEFDHILTANLPVGDSVVVQDPVQSLFAHAVNGGPFITRDALNEGKLPEWYDLRAVASSGTPRCFEFSRDGNHLFVGTGSGVWRYSGLNNLYGDIDPTTVVTGTRIYNNPTGAVTGIVLHPSDDEKMLATMGGYGHQFHVAELSGITTGSTAASTIKEGNLPGFPVYDAEYDVRDPSIVLIGTDFGVWSTQDINASTVEWVNENASLANTPVFDVLQQRLPFQDATNYEVYYLGTHGRGIWSTSSLVNSTRDFADFQDSKIEMGLSTYPNPVVNEGRIDFKLAEQGSVDIRIFDLSGKVIREFPTRTFEAGDNTFTFTAGDIPGGTYVLTVRTGSSFNTSKFVIVK